MPIGVVIGKLEKGLYFAFAIYWIFTSLFISLFQKASIYLQIEKGQPGRYLSREKANRLQNIYLTILSFALIGAIVYDHIKL